MREMLALDPDRPVAVRLLDLDAPETAVLDCTGFDLAMLFFVRRGSIVGRGILPVMDGIISPQALGESVNRIKREGAWEALEARRRATVPLTYSPRVSIVVCTRDRAPILRGCLESLLSLDWTEPEIVVVDNSSDARETRDLLAEFPSIRYVRCARAGLNRSRNAGIRSTSGDIVAFTDDDARVHPSWLRSLVENFRDPMVALTTGITLPANLDSRSSIEFEMTSPFIKGFARKEFTLTNTNMMNIAQIGAGVNMALRRACLDEVGMFDELLDGGTPTISGGDHEFFYRTITRGYRIVYDPSAIVWHHHRQTPAAAIRTVYGYGVGVLAWWTRSLIEERECSVLLRAPICILQYHVCRVISSLFEEPDSPPLNYSMAELRGALYGPLAYLKSVIAVSD